MFAPQPPAPAQPPPPHDPAPIPTATVTNRAPKPPGILPRQAQAWVVAGIALVMVAIIAFTGQTPQVPRLVPPSTLATPLEPNDARIEEYRRRVEEQAKRLAAEQAELELAKEALAHDFSASASASTPPDRTYAPASSDDLASDAPSVDPLSPELRRRDDRARFADSVAFTLPPPPVPAPPASPTAPPQVSPASTGPVGPPPPASWTGRRPSPVTPAPASPPLVRLLEGTVIETVLMNRLDGSFEGPVTCLVTTPVYTPEQFLVIPRGAKVLGRARPVSALGQQRLAVTFHRLVLPDGDSIDLDQFPGLNQAGDTGLHDQVDHHYRQAFGASLALGAIAGLAQYQSRSGLDESFFDTYRQATGANLAQSSTRILDRFLNVLPTVTIREGHRVKIYLTADLELPVPHDK